jgi:hypothetical protein
MARLRALVDEVLEGLPPPVVTNSAARAVTSKEASEGRHSGLSAPKGGFSLKNLSMSGSKAKAVRADAATGASHVYMGLVGPDLSRLAREDGRYPGLGRIEGVAFVDNAVEADSNVNVEGSTVFFTQRRYGPDGSFDPQSPVQAVTRLEAVTGTVFHHNRVEVAAPLAEGDTGNRLYSGAGLGWAEVGLLDATLISSNSTSGGHHSFGGALFASRIETMSRSIAMSNSNTGDHDAFGGAVQASVGLLGGSVLVGNLARGVTSDHVRGTAAAGGALSGSVERLEGSFLGWNRVVSDVSDEAEEREALGGAVHSSKTLVVDGSLFVGNLALANAEAGLAAGGALSLAAATDDSNPRAPRLNETVIVNSAFLNNAALAFKGRAVGGAVAALVSGTGSYRLSLKAAGGRETVFRGNKAAGRKSGLFLGGSAAGGVVLSIEAEAGSAVRLLDPVTADFPGGEDFTVMREGPGELEWGGDNVLKVAEGAQVTVDFGNEGRVTLADDFSLAPGAGRIRARIPGAQVHLKIADPGRTPFERIDFEPINGDLTAEWLGEEDEVTLTLATDCSGLGDMTSEYADPLSKTKTILKLEASGRATLRRERLP